MKVLYMVTKGTSDPTLASIPLHLAANGSLEVGQDVQVLLAGDAAEIILGDNPTSMEGVGVPAMSELIGKLKDRATFYV